MYGMYGMAMYNNVWLWDDSKATITVTFVMFICFHCCVTIDMYVKKT